jgi:methanogenic corrinoid protein MtbC1
MTVQQAYAGYLAAVKAGDRRRAFDVIERARAEGLDLRTLYLEVFQPALREVGRLWEENRITVAEEHLATAITQAAMMRVYDTVELPDRTGPVLIAACVETERHEVGLHMLCDLLELEGWETVFLGSSVPVDSLVQMTVDRSPDVLALSATITPNVPSLRAAITAIRAATGARQPLVLVGGLPFLEDPELAETAGADVTARDAGEAVALLLERFA